MMKPRGFEDFHIETDDQLRSIEESKDMESDRPMDRLLVGDVGLKKRSLCEQPLRQ